MPEALRTGRIHSRPVAGWTSRPAPGAAGPGGLRARPSSGPRPDRGRPRSVRPSGRRAECRWRTRRGPPRPGTDLRYFVAQSRSTDERHAFQDGGDRTGRSARDLVRRIGEDCPRMAPMDVLTHSQESSSRIWATVVPASPVFIKATAGGAVGSSIPSGSGRWGGSGAARRTSRSPAHGPRVGQPRLVEKTPGAQRLGEEPSPLHSGGGFVPEGGQRRGRFSGSSRVSSADEGGQRVQRPGREDLGPDGEGPGPGPEDYRTWWYQRSRVFPSCPCSPRIRRSTAPGHRRRRSRRTRHRRPSPPTADSATSPSAPRPRRSPRSRAHRAVPTPPRSRPVRPRLAAAQPSGHRCL